MTTYELIRDSYDEESKEFETKTKKYPSLDAMMDVVCNVMNAPRMNGYLKVMTFENDEENDTVRIVITQQMSEHTKKKYGVN